jgi:hypothetical protein
LDFILELIFESPRQLFLGNKVTFYDSTSKEGVRVRASVPDFNAGRYTPLHITNETCERVTYLFTYLLDAL